MGRVQAGVSPDKASDAYVHAQRFCSELRHRLRRLLWLQVASRVVLVAVLVALTALGLDIAWHLPMALRLVLLVGLLLSVAVVLWRRLEPLWRLPMDDLEMARIAEARIAELDGALIAELRQFPDEAQTAQRREQYLQASQLQRLVPAGPVPRQVAAALLAVLLAVGCVLIWPHTLAMAGARLGMPWQERPWPRRDVIELQLVETVVAEGEPVPLQVHRLAGGAADLQLHWHAADGRSGQQLVAGDEDGWSVRSLLSRGRYTITAQAGDSLPAVGDVRVQRRPELQAIQVAVHPPGYAPLPVRQEHTLALRVLAGSRLAVRLAAIAEPGRRIAEMQLHQDESPVALIEQADGYHGELRMGSSDVDLQVRCQDEDGIAMRPAVYRLRMLPDRAPTVQLLGPPRGEAVVPGADLRLQLRAEDDIEVVALRLQSRVRPSDAAPEELPFAKGVPVPVPSAATRVDRRQSLTVPSQAEAGQSFDLQAVVADGNTLSGPGQDRSAMLSLRVVDEPELRRILERAIATVRDRVDQSRNRWRQAEDQADQQVVGGTRRNLEALGELQRRWRDNHLPASEGQALGQAEAVLRQQVLDVLPTISQASERIAVDEALGQVYALLDGMLSSGDLLRDLGQLVEQQAALQEESRQLVRDLLLGKVPPERSSDLARRQADVAARQQQWERRLGNDPQHGDKLEQGERPSRQLSEAAKVLRSGQRKQEALSAQQEALKQMQEWYQQLRSGGDGDGEQSDDEQPAKQALLARLQELIEAHQTVLGMVQEGQPLAPLVPQWRQLIQRTNELRQELRESGAEQAALALRLAGELQVATVATLKVGRRDASGSQAQETIALLQQALLALVQQDQQQDLMTLLRSLYQEQVQVTQSLDELAQLAEAGALGFRDQDRQQAITQQQAAIGEALQQVLPAVAEQPLAAWALRAASQAVTASTEHLQLLQTQQAAPTRQSWYQARAAEQALAQLLNVSEELPELQSGQSGGGGGGGQQEQPAFPPRAALNLVRLEQERLARRSATIGGEDLVARQDALLNLIEPLVDQTRPGTRPAQLLARTKQAMERSVAGLVRQQDPAGTRRWQRTAVATLRRTLAEMRMQMNSDGSNQQQQQQQQQQQSAQPQQQQPASAAQSAAGQQQEGEQQAGSGAGSDEQLEGQGWLLQLPPASRARLMEARAAGVPPEGIELYRRYLDLLEEVSP